MLELASFAPAGRHSIYNEPSLGVHATLSEEPNGSRGPYGRRASFWGQYALPVVWSAGFVAGKRRSKSVETSHCVVLSAMKSGYAGDGHLRLSRRPLGPMVPGKSPHRYLINK